MKKQYIFLLLIFLMFYILYLIINYKYKEYNIDFLLNSIEKENKLLKEKLIKDYKQEILYTSTKAYEDKLLKEKLWYKNKSEEVIFFTSKDDFEKYTKKDDNIISISKYKKKEIYDNMTNTEKWFYFLFKKDIR